MSSLQKKTVFTTNHSASLEAAYCDGFVSTGASNSAAIDRYAEELKLDIPVIKVVRDIKSSDCFFGIGEI